MNLTNIMGRPFAGSSPGVMAHLGNRRSGDGLTSDVCELQPHDTLANEWHCVKCCIHSFVSDSARRLQVTEFQASRAKPPVNKSEEKQGCERGSWNHESREFWRRYSEGLGLLFTFGVHGKHAPPCAEHTTASPFARFCLFLVVFFPRQADSQHSVAVNSDFIDMLMEQKVTTHYSNGMAVPPSPHDA